MIFFYSLTVGIELSQHLFLLLLLFCFAMNRLADQYFEKSEGAMIWCILRLFNSH